MDKNHSLDTEAMARERYAASDEFGRNFTLSKSDFDSTNALLRKRNNEYPIPNHSRSVYTQGARQRTHFYDTVDSQAPQVYRSNSRKRPHSVSRFSQGRDHSEYRHHRRNRSQSRSRSRPRNDERMQSSSGPSRSHATSLHASKKMENIDEKIPAIEADAPKLSLKVKEQKDSNMSAKKKKENIIKSKTSSPFASEGKGDRKQTRSPKVKRKRNGASNTTSPLSVPLLETELEAARKKLSLAKEQFDTIRKNVTELEQQMSAKHYEIKDIELVMKGLQDRQQLQKQFISSQNSTESKTHLRRDSFLHAAFPHEQEMHPLPPAIITDPETPKKPETPSRRKPSPLIKKRQVESKAISDIKIKIKHAPRASNCSNTKRKDHFWGTIKTPDLLPHTRISTIPDGSTRKLRTLEFNPVKPDIFATSSDDGSVNLWNYQPSIQQIDKLVSFAPSSFREELPAAESMAWSLDGDRLALAFRDPLPNPITGYGEFCIVRLHQLAIPDDPTEQLAIPTDRIIRKQSNSQSRGISAIAWVPSGRGHHDTRGIITACPNHSVHMWQQPEPSASLIDNASDWKDTFLHEGHRNEIRSLCVHSQGQAVYTGGSDGLVIRYDFHTGMHSSILKRRQSCSIGKINCILEHPLNPNLLLISSVEPYVQSIFLHDIRESYADKQQASSITINVMKEVDARSLSKYVVPRWAFDGFRVSCGSTSGKVHLWDLRAHSDGSQKGLPHQSIQVHRKSV